ncbi:MAG TPA: protein kinase, partial [Waddliaceae bacterium]
TIEAQKTKIRPTGNPLSSSCSKVAKEVFVEYIIRKNFKKNIHKAIAQTYGLTQEQFKALKDLNLTLKEIKNLAKAYQSFAHFLNDKKQPPTFVSRFSFNPPLAFSMVLMPNKKSVYLLLKSRGSAEEVGVGTFNRVTKALNMNAPKELSVFRTARYDHVDEEEQETMQLLSTHNKYFVLGDPVKYYGKWRPRLVKRGDQTILKDERPDLYRRITSQMNVLKIGYLMPHAGRSLWQLDVSFLDSGAISLIAEKCSRAVAALHLFGIVHGDLKPENIFISECGDIKIGDFGFATKEGNRRSLGGSPGYNSPERYSSQYPRFARSMDIWSLGCVFANLFNGDHWLEWCEVKHEKNEWRGIEEKVLQKAKNLFFPERKNQYHHEYIISTCLRLNPRARPSAEELVKAWEAMNASYSSSDSD